MGKDNEDGPTPQRWLKQRGGWEGGRSGVSRSTRRFVHVGHDRTLTERPRDSFRKQGKTGK